MNYPLGVNEKDSIFSKTGKSLSDITLENLLKGEISEEDIKISRETLNKQADVAKEANRTNLAENFARASELVDMDDELILEIYNKLRPNRATKQELLNLAEMIRLKFNAQNCADLILEACEVYEKRGILNKV